eukprot:356183-Chlamydomonas_euryale.AAC.2
MRGQQDCSCKQGCARAVLAGGDPEAPAGRAVPEDCVPAEGGRALPAALRVCVPAPSHLLEHEMKGHMRARTPALPPLQKPRPKPKGLEPPPPPNFADVAVCSACGALHHLTFLDEAKLQLGELGSVGPAILVAASRTGNPTTYENATGALWNVGLDVSNTLQLRAAAAPAYLAVPAGWLTDSRAALGMNLKDDDEDDEDDEEGGAGGADDAEEYPSTTFLTAPGAWAPQPPGLVAR